MPTIVTSSSSLGVSDPATASQMSTTSTSRPRSAATLVPTNTVTTKAGVTVRARIDPALAVADVVRQLVLSLKLPEPPSEFALRDDAEELVTDENMRRKIMSKVPLKLVSAPAIEAEAIVETLASRDEKNLRRVVFSLQKYIKEEQFADAFLMRNGLTELVGIIEVSQGNTLAYALTAMQHLLELDSGWPPLQPAFILRVVQILAAERSLVNVCRPATAILKRLVELDAAAAPGPLVPSSSRGPPPLPAGSVYRYGFDVVFTEMRKEIGLLETVVGRLGSGETALVLYSLMLINSLLSHATDMWWDEFMGELDRLNVRRVVVRLMYSLTSEELTSVILDFQANMARATYRKKTTLVEPAVEPAQSQALEYVWRASRLEETRDEQGFPSRWRQLGFDGEDMGKEFGGVGLLGLHSLRHFVESDPDFFAKVVIEQNCRPAERRCPIGKASNEVVELLSEHWAIYAGSGYSTSTTFRPFFLSFSKVHALATTFFLRMWAESGAAAGDFVRVSALVRSQVKYALRQENVRPWHEVEAEFGGTEYRAVRDRLVKELEEEDDLLSKVPVRNLRAKLYSEAGEFVRQQRIHCLLAGAWFANAVPAGAQGNGRRPSKPWRYLRLESGMRWLHFVDSATKFPVRPGLEDLPERIDMNLITEIGTGGGAAPGAPAGAASPLSFALVNADQGPLAELLAPDAARWADWTDGLNMLRRDGGHVASAETEGFVQALTEIGLKIKLLDLSGEKATIPSGLSAGPPPANLDYFFGNFDFDG